MGTRGHFFLNMTIPNFVVVSMILIIGRLKLAGIAGQVGDDAPPPPPLRSKGFIFTRHSQSTQVPECPRGTLKMWDGYSLLHFTGDAKAHGQDLGKAAISTANRFSFSRLKNDPKARSLHQNFVNANLS